MSQSITLVLGGAASGKSLFAERLVLGHGAQATYVATAAPGDGEMARKIARHRARRGAEWSLIEATTDLAGALGTGQSGQTMLIDCATMWLSNLMAAEADLDAAFDGLETALSASAADVVIVSNELGLGLVPMEPLSRRFREAQGALNQRLASIAQQVAFVAAGLPLWLKGGPT